MRIPGTVVQQGSGQPTADGAALGDAALPLLGVGHATRPAGQRWRRPPFPTGRTGAQEARWQRT